MKKAKPCARAFRANCGKDFFRCCRSDHNQSDFAFFTTPLRIFFIFSKTRLLYCDFRLKLRAARLLQMRFAIKSRFQQLPNLTIHSLLKIKEGLKTATKIVRRVASPPCYRVFARSQDWQTKTLVACFNASFEKIERTFFQL